jgi:hypothetical protein
MYNRFYDSQVNEMRAQKWEPISTIHNTDQLP